MKDNYSSNTEPDWQVLLAAMLEQFEWNNVYGTWELHISHDSMLIYQQMGVRT